MYANELEFYDITFIGDHGLCLQSTHKFCEYTSYEIKLCQNSANSIISFTFRLHDMIFWTTWRTQKWILFRVTYAQWSRCKERGKKYVWCEFESPNVLLQTSGRIFVASTMAHSFVIKWLVFLLGLLFDSETQTVTAFQTKLNQMIL